jgi:zinc transport system substrate-binding protein
MISVLIDLLACSKVRVLGVLLVTGLLSLSGCGGSDGDLPNPTIVASFYPLAWAAERIGQFPVVNLTPPGAEPHDVELSPRDVETVRDAVYVLYVDSGFQPAVEDAVKSRSRDSLDVLGAAESDPHVWLDPARFVSIATEIGSYFGTVGPARDLARELRLLDSQYRTGLSRCRRRTLVTTHAAFGHLAARYGLTQLSLAGRSPEAEPAPRELENLIEKVRASGATTVFSEPLVSDRLAETVAREAGAGVAVLDPIEGLSAERLAAGEDYLSVMRQNLATLREALGCT